MAAKEGGRGVGKMGLRVTPPPPAEQCSSRPAKGGDFFKYCLWALVSVSLVAALFLLALFGVLHTQCELHS